MSNFQSGPFYLYSREDKDQNQRSLGASRTGGYSDYDFRASFYEHQKFRMIFVRIRRGRTHSIGIEKVLEKVPGIREATLKLSEKSETATKH